MLRFTKLFPRNFISLGRGVLSEWIGFNFWHGEICQDVGYETTNLAWSMKTNLKQISFVLSTYKICYKLLLFTLLKLLYIFTFLWKQWDAFCVPFPVPFNDTSSYTSSPLIFLAFVTACKDNFPSSFSLSEKSLLTILNQNAQKPDDIKNMFSNIFSLVFADCLEGFYGGIHWH